MVALVFERSVCLCSGQRQSRAPSNTPVLLDTMISTECQEQQQLTGSVRRSLCVPARLGMCVAWLHRCIFVCLCVCVCVCTPHQKQRNPNTRSCMSINITGCQSTSNNAAVIYDNTNTSSCGKPEKLPQQRALREPGLVLTIQGCTLKCKCSWGLRRVAG